ncbi:hypothetical protein MLD38_039780 [Melastoma candidum]|uniref:Uncharacterized protein n=1 Tax=Melastoma candidum TaxID=119954 RepID=A0ACB9L4C3_9MYRT|nr:hypothetical protein MLD38_039780 [Melastoma candidum]
MSLSETPRLGPLKSEPTKTTPTTLHDVSRLGSRHVVPFNAQTRVVQFIPSQTIAVAPLRLKNAITRACLSAIDCDLHPHPNVHGSRLGKDGEIG